MSDKPMINSLRLKDAELDTLLAELERNTTGWGGNSKREMRRWGLGGVRAVVTIVEGMGTQRHALTIPRNISTTGMGCVHGAFLHIGTRCFLSLRDMSGAARSISGTVVRCKHLRGLLHEVGIKFDSPVRPEDFREFNDEHVFHREHVDLSTLRGVVLIVENSVLDQKLVAAFFKQSSLELIYARDAKTGLELLGESPDLVFVDHGLPDMPGVEFIREATHSGFAKPMILMTADSSPGLRSAAAEAGAVEVLVKPLGADLMRRAAAEYLISGSSGSRGRGTIVSERDPQIIDAPMVDEYVKELHRLAHELGQLLRAEDAQGIRGKANFIRGTAEGYGFKVVTDAATQVVSRLDASSNASDSVAEIRHLISVCQRTVPSTASPEEPEAPEAKPSK